MNFFNEIESYISQLYKYLTLNDIKYLEEIKEVSTSQVRATSLILGCFSLKNVKGVKKVFWNGVDIFTKGNINKVPISRIRQLIQKIKIDNLNYLYKRGYKFRFHKINIDILDDTGAMIFRGSSDEMAEFLKYHRLPIDEKVNWLKEAKLGVQNSKTQKYYYDRRETERLLGVDVQPSGTALEPGLSPDFAKGDATQFLFKQDPEMGKIQIKMSGSREVDFKLANEIAKLPDTPKGYTWHHLDDVIIDPVSGELQCTMQLVETFAHKNVIIPSQKGQLQSLFDVVNAGKHIGSVAVWRQFYIAVKYKK